MIFFYFADMYTIDISTSKYNFTCSGFLKTTDITKLAYKYWYKQTDGGKFPKEMKADINALYIFPKGEHTFLEIQKLDNMDKRGEWKWSKVNSKNMEGVSTATYKGMEKDKSKYYPTGLEKKVWHHLETNMALVQYQGPQYNAADNHTPPQEDNLRLDAILKEMKNLPQMIDNLPEDEEVDSLIETDTTADSEDIEIDGEYDMTHEMEPDTMYFNIQTSEMACQTTNLTSKTGTSKTGPSKSSRKPKCQTKRMDMWLVIRKRDKKLIQKLKKQLKKSK